MQELFLRQKNKRWSIARTTFSERREKLRRLESAILKNREALAAAVFQDFQKPRAEFEVSEILPCIDEIRFMCRHLKKWMRPKRVPTPSTLFGCQSEIRFEAKGTSLIIAPWNYPFYLAIAPLAAAIAAGNTVILKPSEKTPHLSAALLKLLQSIFPDDEVAVVLGAADVSQELLALPFDHIFFTGSTRVGKKVMEAASKHLASVTLELGGKSPAIFDESAELEKVLPRLVWAKFINAGQTCVAPDYVLVPEIMQQKFLLALQSAIAKGINPSLDYTSIVDTPGLQRLQSLLDSSVQAGAKKWELAPAVANCLAPTVLSEVQAAHPIMQEEIFGPILPILTYKKLDEALEFVRAGDKPLALYIFSEKSEQVDYILANTNSGGAVVNNAIIHLVNPHLPFGGTGASGQGSYHGYYGFKAFSHERAVLRHRISGFIHWLYPPYNRFQFRWALRILEKLI